MFQIETDLVSHPLRKKYQMFEIIEFGRKKALDIIYFRALCLIVRMKILVMGCLFGKMKNFKHIIPFLMTLLCLATPSIFWAQETNRPWILDGGNFAITNSSENSFFPSVASNDQLYFVVWHQKTVSGFCIYGARITREGYLVDPGGIPICTAKNDQMYPSVAWDGVNFFVVWQDKRNGTRWDIYGARVNPEANPEEAVLDPDGIPIAVGKSSYDQVSPVLSFDGENYLVVWQGKKNSKIWNIYFSMVSKNRKVINKKPIALNPSSKDQTFPAVSFDGGSYFVVWQEARSNQFWGIVGARVIPSGEIVDTDGIEISPAADEEIQWDRWKPEVSWDGRLYFITWTSQREKDQWMIEGKRFDPFFNNMDTEDLILQKDSISKIFPTVLWDDQEEEYLLLWEEGAAEGESKIYGASLQAQFRPFVEGDAVPISSSDAKDSSMPKASRIEDEILVIWQGIGPEGNWQVYGQLLKNNRREISELFQKP